MRQLLLCIVAGAIWSGTAVAAAQEAPPLEQLTADAAIAGVATVQSITARVNPTNNMIYTDHVLKFSDVWKGEPADPFILTKVGGQLGGRTVSVPGHEFKLNVGDSIAVFAMKNQFGDYVTLGIHDGLFRVDPSGNNLVRPVLASKSELLHPMTLLALREKAFRALGRPWTEPPKLIAPPKTPKPFGAAAPDPAVAPSDPSTPQSPSGVAEPRGNHAWVVVAGLLILAAIVAVFIRRKSKAEPNHTR
jgi:hypothetical protein